MARPRWPALSSSCRPHPRHSRHPQRPPTSTFQIEDLPEHTPHPAHHLPPSAERAESVRWRRQTTMTGSTTSSTRSRRPTLEATSCERAGRHTRPVLQPLPVRMTTPPGWWLQPGADRIALSLCPCSAGEVLGALPQQPTRRPRASKSPRATVRAAAEAGGGAGRPPTSFTTTTTMQTPSLRWPALLHSSLRPPPHPSVRWGPLQEASCAGSLTVPDGAFVANCYCMPRHAGTSAGAFNSLKRKVEVGARVLLPQARAGCEVGAWCSDCLQAASYWVVAGQ